MNIQEAEILTIEKQILRDIAACVRQYSSTLEHQLPLKYLTQAKNAVWELNRIADDLEKIAK